MTYTLDESISSPNFTPASSVLAVFGYPRVIIGYTIHHWDDKNSGANWDGTIATLCNDYRNPGSRGVSAHFVLEANRVACLVTPADAAWHAGNGKGNAQTIGIEVNPNEAEDTYHTLIEFVAWLFGRYGVLPLFHHYDWTATSCPGGYDLDRVYRDALALHNAGGASTPVAPESGTVVPVPPTQAPAPQPAPPKATAYVPDLHWEVAAGENLTMVANYFGESVAEVQRYNGIADANVIGRGEWIWPSTGYGTWTVDPGDTLTSIVNWCKANWNQDITVDKVCNANGINDPNSLSVGRRLQIPR